VNGKQFMQLFWVKYFIRIYNLLCALLINSSFFIGSQKESGKNYKTFYSDTSCIKELHSQTNKHDRRGNQILKSENITQISYY